MDELNKTNQDLRPGEPVVFKSHDYMYICDAAEGESSHFSDAFLDKLNSQVVPPHLLVLKPLDYYFLVRNYSLDAIGLRQQMNGTKVRLRNYPIVVSVGYSYGIWKLMMFTLFLAIALRSTIGITGGTSHSLK